MQMAILAGGQATRLGSVTEHTPKSLLSIGGRPFVEYQLQTLRQGGITEVVLCLGHLAQPIIDYLGDGSAYGLRLTYSREAQPRGTAGALKLAEPLLADPFFVIYGDSYLPLDCTAIWDYFHRFDRLALLVVFENHDHYDHSNVALKGPLVSAYDKANPAPEMVYIDAGVSLLRKEVLGLIDDNGTTDLADVFEQLARRGQLLAFETKQRFYEVGSRNGLEEFSRLVTTGALA